MIRNLFKKITADDVLEELTSTSFKESKIKSMLQYININHNNQNLQTFLHLLAPKNNIKSIKWLLEHNINYNAVDLFENTATILASKHGHINMIIELLKKQDLNIDYENHNGHTAIDFAILNNHFNIYKKIKPRIHDLNKKDKKNLTILHLAIKAENYEVIDDLFSDHDFNITNELLFYEYTYINKTMISHIMNKFENINIKDSSERNILFYVIKNGYKYKDIFNSLISKGLDLNCIDNEGNNILLYLIKLILEKEDNFFEKEPEDLKKHKEEISNLINFIPIILEKDINTFICNKENETILSLPAKKNNIDILSKLLKSQISVDMENRDKKTALSLIITKGDKYLDLIYLLLNYGANTNKKDKNGKTIIEKLIDAVLITENNKQAMNYVKRDLDYKTKYFSILEMTLFNGEVNLSLLNSKNEPYIFDVLKYGNIDLLKVLVKHGANINQTDSHGNNIIFMYMEENKNLKKISQEKEYHNNLHTIILLGANVNAKDSNGEIPLHRAILDSNLQLIKLFLNLGADIHALDRKGRNILHNTILKNNLKVFKLIYPQDKSLLNKPDKFGILGINYAAFLGYKTFVLELIELGAYINNPYKKSKYILDFLKKFHKNMKTLQEEPITKAQKIKIKKLIENMKEEFEIES